MYTMSIMIFSVIVFGLVKSVVFRVCTDSYTRDIGISSIMIDSEVSNIKIARIVICTSG